MSTFTHFGIAATDMALKDAKWNPQDSIGKERTVKIILHFTFSLHEKNNTKFKIKKKNKD